MFYISDANGSETKRINRAETFETKIEADQWIAKMFPSANNLVSVPYDDSDDCFVILIKTL